MSIQRYEVYPQDPCGFIKRVPQEDGIYVLYQDYKAEFQRIKRMLEAMRIEYRANACGIQYPRTDCGYTKLAEKPEIIIGSMK